MRRSVLVLIAAMAVIASACGGRSVESPGDRDDRPLDASRDDASIRAGGEGLSTPASAGAPIGFPEEPLTLTIDGVDYRAGVDNDGCVSLLVLVDDTFYTPQRRCESPLDGHWSDTVHCAFRPEPARDDGGNGGDLIALPPCEVEIPPVVIGHELGSPDLLCLAAESESGFGPVHFVELNADNLWLAAVPAAGEGYSPFAYTSDGRHYGEAPIDGGAAEVWAMCDAAGPWSEAPPAEARLTVMVRFRGLAGEVGGLFFDYGSGPEWVAFEFGEEVFVEATTFTDTTGVDLAVFFDDLAVQTPLGFYPYPDEIIAELTSGWECPDGPSLLIDVGPEVLDADPTAVTFGVLTPGEKTEFGGPAAATDRRPGEPCPDTGTRRSAPERPSAPARLLQTMVVWDLDDSWLTLGSDWSLVLLLEVSPTDRFGYIGDLGFLAANPDENRFGGELIGPGSVLLVGILPTAEGDSPDDPRLIALKVPPLPEGRLADIDGGAVLDLIIEPAAGDATQLDAAMIELSWRTG